MIKREEIEQLKAEQDVVILAHYYVDPQVQEVTDHIGDPFYSSKVTAGLDRRTMVLCGVSPVRESGKLLNSDKVVLTPDVQTDCPMVHMATKEEVEQYRREYPNPAMVCYINSTIEIKSWFDVCVTPVNTAQIVRNPPNRDIPFISDKNLGRYVASQAPEKHVIPVNGCCSVHDQMSLKEVFALEEIHSNAQVLAHLECNAQVLELADYIGSTTGTLKFAADSTSREFIICTENGVRHKLEWQNLGRHFYFPDTEPICRDMRKTALDKIIHAPRTGQNQASAPKVYVPSVDRALEQMFNLARQSPESRSQAVDFRQPISQGGIRK